MAVSNIVLEAVLKAVARAVNAQESSIGAEYYPGEAYRITLDVDGLREALVLELKRD